MPVSDRPFFRLIPFVNAQDIRISTNVEKSLTVELTLSNETARLQKKRPINFGNYVYFSESKDELEKLSESPAQLFNLIRKETQNKKLFSLYASDFKEKTRASKGVVVYNSLFQKKYVVPRSDNLYLLACSFFERNGQIMLGNIVKEELIKDDISPINSRIYQLEETDEKYGIKGSVWPGSVHLSNGRPMAGNVHSGRAHPFLRSHSVPNIRIKDLRVLEEAKLIDYGFAQRESSGAYFSPATIFRNAKGNIHGLFSFNLLENAKDKTKFGSFIQNDSSLLSAIEIKDIIVFQRTIGRQQAGNKLTPGHEKRCGPKKSSLFTKIASLNNGCTILDVVLGQEGVLQISFIDTLVQKYNSGTIEYKAEVVLKDHTGDLLTKVLAPIKANLKGDLYEHDRLKTLIGDYVAGLQIVFGSMPFRKFSEKNLQKNLLAMVHPSNPNLKNDVISVLNLVTDFVRNLSEFISGFQKAADVTDLKSRIYNSKKETFVRNVHLFSENFIIRGTPNYGLNYLDNDLAGDDSSIPKIGFKDYKARADSEIKKYGIINTGAAALNTLGYLSPASVNLTVNPTELKTDTLEINNEQFLSLVKDKKEKNNNVFNPKKSVKDESLKEDILRALGIKVKQNKINLKKSFKKGKILTFQNIDSEIYLSPTSDFLYESTVSDNVSGSSSPVTKKVEDKVYNTELVNILVDKAVSSFGEKAKLINIDLLKGSPALKRVEEGGDILLTNSAMGNLINFNSVVQVQYLDSYDYKLGIKNQNWKLLGKQKFNNANTGGYPLICKIKKISNTINSPDIVDMEPMSGIFVIGDPKTKTKFVSTEVVIGRTKERLEENFASDLASSKDDILYSKNTPMSLHKQETSDTPETNSSTSVEGNRY